MKALKQLKLLKHTKILIYVILSLLITTISQTTFANTHCPSPKSSHKKLNVFVAAEKAIWFEQGNPNAAHQLYVIAEPNCSACHYLYESIRPYIGNGSLKVRWIMVAFLKPSSLDKAATIVSSKNPAQALENNETTFNTSNEEGGITPSSSIYPGAKKIITNNTDFMKAYGFKRTPIIIFKSNTGKTEVLRGAPEQKKWSELLPYIGKYK